MYNPSPWGQSELTSRRYNPPGAGPGWEDSKKDIRSSRNWGTGAGFYGGFFERGESPQHGYAVHGNIDQLYETFRTMEDPGLAMKAVGGGELYTDSSLVRSDDGDYRLERSVTNVHEVTGNKDLFNSLMISERLRRSAYKQSFFGE